MGLISRPIRPARGESHDPQSQSNLARHRPRRQRRAVERFRILAATPYSFKTRFESEKGTNPEELIAAAHAGCFTMALAFQLEGAGFTDRAATEAAVTLEPEGKGFEISRSALTLRAKVPNLDAETFARLPAMRRRTARYRSFSRRRSPWTLSSSDVPRGDMMIGSARWCGPPHPQSVRKEPAMVTDAKNTAALDTPSGLSQEAVHDIPPGSRRCSPTPSRSI